MLTTIILQENKPFYIKTISENLIRIIDLIPSKDWNAFLEEWSEIKDKIHKCIFCNKIWKFKYNLCTYHKKLQMYYLKRWYIENIEENYKTIPNS